MNRPNKTYQKLSYSARILIIYLDKKYLVVSLTLDVGNKKSFDAYFRLGYVKYV